MNAAEIAILVTARNIAKPVMRDAVGDVFGLKSALQDLGLSSKSAESVVTGAMTGLGVAIGIMAVKAVEDIGKLIGKVEESAQSFQYMTTIIRNNTLMTDAEFNAMIGTTKNLAGQTGSSMQDIAEAYRHVANLGFDMADANNIVIAGNQLAVATGSNVADTTNRVAGVMKEYGIAARDAGVAENTMFAIAAQGNMTMQQLADFSGRLNAVTGALGGQLTDVGAAMDALTRHGFDAAQAQTQLLGIITHIVAPTSAAEKELERLSRTSGVDLVNDFSLAGLQAKGLSGIFNDLRVATAGNTSEIFRLIPAYRGGQGAVALLTTATADYQSALDYLNKTETGEATPATEAFGRTMGTTTQQAEALHQKILGLETILGAPLNTAKDAAVSALNAMGDGFDRLGGHIDGAIKKLFTFMGAYDKNAQAALTFDPTKPYGPGNGLPLPGGGPSVAPEGAPAQYPDESRGAFNPYLNPLSDTAQKQMDDAVKAALAHPMLDARDISEKNFTSSAATAGRSPFDYFGFDSRGGGGGGLSAAGQQAKSAMDLLSERIDVLRQHTQDLDSQFTALKDAAIAGTQAFKDQQHAFELQDARVKLQEDRMLLGAGGNAAREQAIRNSSAFKALEARGSQISLRSEIAGYQNTLGIGDQQYQLQKTIDQITGKNKEFSFADLMKQAQGLAGPYTQSKQLLTDLTIVKAFAEAMQSQQNVGNKAKNITISGDLVHIDQVATTGNADDVHKLAQSLSQLLQGSLDQVIGQGSGVQPVGTTARP